MVIQPTVGRKVSQPIDFVCIQFLTVVVIYTTCVELYEQYSRSRPSRTQCSQFYFYGPLDLRHLRERSTMAVSIP